MFATYPKINTLFKREEKKPCRIIVGDYTHPEFENIKTWQVQEKVNGTNIRIFWDGYSVYFGGRTDNAQLSTLLLLELQNIFTVDRMREVFPDTPSSGVILFGEGYGAGIQSGGNYRPTPSFILFDIKVAHWWLQRDTCVEIAYKLSIPIVPLIHQSMQTQDIIDYVKGKPKSECSIIEQQSEGIVAKTDLLMRNGARLWFKLKARDFE